MSRRVRILLAIMLCLASMPVIGQEFPMLHYTLNDGLPSNNVYQVFRDSKGYIWIATDKGVTRYNGIKFEKFTTFNGLADNEIFFFKEDLYGRIWFGTFNGELCYYLNDSFHNAQNTPFLKLPFKSPHTYCIIGEKDSSITINYYDKRILVNIKNNKCNTYHIGCITDRSGGDIIYNRKVSDGLYEATYRRNNLIEGNTSKDIVIDTLCNIIKTIPTDLDITGKIALSQNETYFIGHGLVYSEDKKILRRFKNGFVYNNYINSYYGDSLNYFLGTNHGLYINDSLQVFKDDNASSITSDNSGNYWVGTLNNGVYCIRKGFINTSVFRNSYSGVAKYCYADTGHIFFTTSNNSLFSLEGKQIRTIFNDKRLKNTPDAYPINDPAYLIDASYRYYNLYNVDFILLDDIRSKNVIQHLYKNRFFWATIKAILSTGDYIYFQGRDRIFREKATDLKDSIVEIVTNPNSEDRIISMSKNEDNEVWYSTINAVYNVQDGHGVPQPQFNKVTFKSFGFYGKYLVGYTHLNKLVICTDIHGHIKIDSVPTPNCIWDKLYRLDADHILISTDNLYRVLTLKQGSDGEPFPVFAIEDPFIPLHAEAISSDGSKCYFFSNGSITSIDIKSLLVKPKPPKLFFTLLKTGGSAYPIENEVDIPFVEEKNILVLFSTLSTGGKHIFYQYSISKNGTDHWNSLVSESVNLFDPGYGDYVVKVRAKSISSDYCIPVTFILHISKPFWATWWFIILSVFAIAILVGIGIRRRIAYVLRKNKKEHDTEIKFMKSEYKALNALMNPHFIFNTLNNVQSLVNENDKEAANTYLRIFADLIRQNMHNVSKELIPLQKEIELVTNYLLLEKLRFEDKLNYAINIDRSLDLSDILVPPLLIQPIVENSIKHGIFSLNSLEGKIEINIYEKGEVLTIEIKDNGAGMSQPKDRHETMHESFGLSNIKKRIQQLSIIQNKEITFSIADIVDESGKVAGTIAIITIPVSG